ncbi:helix-turn-helix transcriptional regulator [Actinocorallia sp. A-T 12471]|uniref:helix-turn-helix domain-containing protein n=1 Tax=Actinocorallia sp. A-T 12471 TaxID=3089813 RepID=UPI0029D2D7CE|nr:helix-turn-helix transcriptional regulator [Actinocorallia sp. A-T 12471]MDX6743808.1 helix-turn-helix transcriptional regulator [Actinocorallia sp. A-T 12471]
MSQIFQIPEGSEGLDVPVAQQNLYSHFADTLRVLRQLKGVTQLDVARGIFVARETYTGWENQRALPDEENCTALDEFFGVGAYVKNLREQCLREHVPSWFRAYVGHEATAREMRTYQPSFIPGVLQTEAYMRLIADPGPQDEENIANRLARCDILTREDDPLHLFAVIDEAALIRTRERPDVMREQLAHLLKMAALPNVHIQVTRMNAPQHPGLNGALVVLTTPELSRIGWVEAQFGGRLIQDRTETWKLSLRFDEIRGVALTEGDSLALIRHIMETIHDDRVA